MPTFITFHHPGSWQPVKINVDYISHAFEETQYPQYSHTKVVMHNGSIVPIAETLDQFEEKCNASLSG
jgi:hypothetical protein